MNGRLIPLDANDIIAIHDVAVLRFGGAYGIRDDGLLEAAAAQPFQSYDGKELYPTAVQKAARYAYGISSAHPFVDGNKRTAAAAMGTFLRINGYRFKPRHDELLDTMLELAAGATSFENLAQWVERVLSSE